MDIRKYFGGGPKTQVKKEAAPLSNSKPNKKAKSKTPTKTGSLSKTPKSDKKKSTPTDIVVVDSDSSDAPIKIKNRNVKKDVPDDKKDDIQKVKKSDKPAEKDTKKSKSKESKLPAAEGSPGEKENKEHEKKAEKVKKDERSRKEEKSALKDVEKERKEVEKERKETKKKQLETSEASVDRRKPTPKRKAARVIESSDEEEEEVKAKPSKTKGRKGIRIFVSDSDEDPLPAEQRSIKKKRRPSTIVSDTDEELQPSIESAFKKVVTKKSPKKQAPPKAQVKACSVSDFFGSSTVHRVDRKVTSVKRKAETSMAEEDLFDDMEIHDDEDFEKTLAMLDETQHTPKKVKLEMDSKIQSAGTSLASKLATKAKMEVDSVAKSPENKIIPQTTSVRTIKQIPVSEKQKAKTSPKKGSPVKRETGTKRSPNKPSFSTPEPSKKPSPKKPSPVKQTPEKSSADAEGTPKLTRGGTPSFRNYLQRSGPQALGSKEIPEGEPNCLEGLTFVLTGVYESIERDDCKALVEKLGGKVTTSLSKKTSYVVIGRDAGVSKLAKANDIGTKQLDEDALFDLIRNAKGKKSKYEMAAEAEFMKEKRMTPKASPKVGASPSTSKVSTPKSSKPSLTKPSPQVPSNKSDNEEEAGLMWVDKHKPKNLKQIIGQQGPKSNANKLLFWLKNWHKWVAQGRKPAFNSRFGGDDGAGFRAALLSGPPGVGKTTTSTLVCKEVGFSYVELNASDTRSKKSLETEVAELLGNHTLVDFFGGAPKSERPNSTEGQSHCLIMDEVDGMSGNADRGGMAELIQLIKKSKIPIICMCNDRNNQKIRSLANYCFDLRFQRPRIEQIKAAMMSLAYREGVKIPPPALNEMISASNQDVRQVIHNLSMWTATNKAPTFEQVKADAAKATKDIKLGPFDVCRKVFVGGEETAKMTIHDKSNLFFHDYSFGPLFVHENYLSATPYAAKGDKKKHLDCISRAIDAISDGDMVDRLIRRNQNWSLLPTEAVYASVLPGEIMRGGFNSKIDFPQWLGKNSSTNKTDRILSELSMHMSLKVSANKSSLNLDYLPFLRNALTKPLAERQQEGVPDVLQVMDEYSLLREDYDSILEVTQWSNRRDPLANVETKTKAAFTRAYNKEAHLQPYAAVVATKKGRGRGGGGGGGGESDPFGEETEVVEEEGSGDDDPSSDAMIKPKKKKGKAASTTTAKGKGRGGGSSRGSGRGRGRGKSSK